MIQITSKQNVSAAKKKAFQKKVLSYYKKHGRDLPWRKTHDPYHILISELMLQQTQALRVIPKYAEFLKKFKTVKALANASTKEVIEAWQGLGYNRRALYLKRAAEMIVKEYQGTVPKDATLLQALPGIGPYTARAIIAFAFNKREVFIETNIRSVYIHEFFRDTDSIPDDQILTLVEETLPSMNYREWYGALMDYGAMLKRTVPNPSRKSKTHVRQKSFVGSNRQARGEILRLLLKKSRTGIELQKLLGRKQSQLVEALVREGFASKEKGVYSLVV